MEVSNTHARWTDMVKGNVTTFNEGIVTLGAAPVDIVNTAISYPGVGGIFWVHYRYFYTKGAVGGETYVYLTSNAGGVAWTLGIIDANNIVINVRTTPAGESFSQSGSVQCRVFSGPGGVASTVNLAVQGFCVAGDASFQIGGFQMRVETLF